MNEEKFLNDKSRSQLRERVSRETFERLTLIESQLQKWQPRINLVSPTTLDTAWHRHIQDSIQLFFLRPEAAKWIDIGSGGGFPGLVLGAMLAERQAGHITLVESNAKKCAFLRETARIAKLPVLVINERIERVLPNLTESYEVLTARALSPLAELLTLAQPVIAKGAVCIFPKGQDVDDEIKRATISWNFTYDLFDSETDSAARILLVKSSSKRV